MSKRAVDLSLGELKAAGAHAAQRAAEEARKAGLLVSGVPARGTIKQGRFIGQLTLAATQEAVPAEQQNMGGHRKLLD